MGTLVVTSLSVRYPSGDWKGQEVLTLVGGAGRQSLHQWRERLQRGRRPGWYEPLAVMPSECVDLWLSLARTPQGTDPFPRASWRQRIGYGSRGGSPSGRGG